MYQDFLFELLTGKYYMGLEKVKLKNRCDTMRIQRELFLKVLESVSSGLATRELIEQSSCFCFTEDGRVCTFNDELLASRESPLKIVGAVNAKPLLALLSKMVEDDLDIEHVDGELIVKGTGRRSGIRMESEVSLPVEVVEMPANWRLLDPEFGDAVSIVCPCASAEESQFVLTCVHIHPDYVESCDRFQIVRYALKTGVAKSTLVRAESMKKILGLGMSEMSETDAWVHFRNSDGLVLSIRRYLDEYVSLDKFISAEGTTPFILPGGIEEAVAKAEIFSGDNVIGNKVLVDLRSDLFEIKGEGATGWYRERKKVVYSGSPIQFLIAPRILVEITKKSNECGVSRDRLFVDGGKFKYATSTSVVEEKKEKKSEKEMNVES